MIHMIYMAAGNSSRFGENKLITMRKGQYLFSYGLETLIKVLKKSPEERTLTVVTRFPEVFRFTEELKKENADIAELFQAVDSPESVEGASFTIKNGIKASEKAFGPMGNEDYLLFMVSDQPDLKPETLERMLNAAIEDAPETLSLRFGDTPGNPCMFRGDLVPELMAISGDRGGRAVVKKHNCRYIEADSLSELRDIDEKKDLNA